MLLSSIELILAVALPAAMGVGYLIRSLQSRRSPAPAPTPTPAPPAADPPPALGEGLILQLLGRKVRDRLEERLHDLLDGVLAPRQPNRPAA